MMKKALFAGVFDPPTTGHLDLIARAAGMFETLYVGVAENRGKGQTLFSAEKRKHFLEIAVKQHKNVVVELVPGLLVEFANAKGIDILVRGLRPGADFSEEYARAFSNRQLSGIETLFLGASPLYCHIQSTVVREILQAGGSVEGFVPDVLLLKNGKLMKASKLR
jgi:pantetheine-phosphate adenylyltransferase